MHLCVAVFAIFSALSLWADTTVSGAKTRSGACPESVQMAIGSYTYQTWLPEGKGEGVTILSLTNSGLTKLKLFSNLTVTGQNPSYCQKSVLERGIIYCTRNVPGAERSGVTRWRYDMQAQASAVLKADGGEGSGGASHIEVVKEYGGGERLITSNYGGSSVSSLLYRDGRITVQDVDLIPAHYATEHKAVGYHQQNAPHPHFALPLGKGYFLVADLGADRVWLYRVTRAGKLRRYSGIRMKPGDGPRHLARGRGKNIYVVNEISNSVARINGCARGFLRRECERMSILTDGLGKDASGASSAAIRVSADAKFLYASIRPAEAYGAIAAFELAQDGRIMRRVGVFSTHGVHPRDFNIIENGPGCKSYVVVGNMNSDTVVVMERNKVTGAILDAKPRSSITIGTPTVIVNL